MDQVVRNTEAAADILSMARETAPRPGVKLLKGAHVYLYAALLSDFVIAAKQDDWIGPAVRMNDSTVKPTDKFLMDHLFETVFAPLFQNGGQEFLDAVREKASSLIGVPV